MQWQKDRPFNKWWWENWRNKCRKMKLDPYLIPLTNISSKWIKDLNIRVGTIKLLEENVGKKLLNHDLGNDFFLDVTPKAQTTKAKNQQVGLYQTNKMRRYLLEWKKMFANHISDNNWIDIFPRRTSKWSKGTWKDAQHY